MQWAILQFAFALGVVIGIIALILAELHIVERAEEQKFRCEIETLRQKIARIR